MGKYLLFTLWGICSAYVIPANAFNSEAEAASSYGMVLFLLPDSLHEAMLTGHNPSTQNHSFGLGTERTPVDMIDRSGRTELIISSMALSLGYHGWAVPETFYPYQDWPYIASYAVFGSSSFLVPYAATRNRPVTTGMARGYLAGGILGIPHGWALSVLVQKDYSCNCNINYLGLSISTATSIAEGYLGLKYAKHNNLNGGHMSLVTGGGLLGGLYGVCLPAFFRSENDNVYAISTLAFSGLGMVLSDVVGRSYLPSEGDIFLLANTSAIGAFLGTTVVVGANEYASIEAVVLGMILGSAASLPIGVKMIKGFDYKPHHGLFTMAGTAIGGATGIFASYSLTRGSGDFLPYMIGASIGGISGFYLTDRTIKNHSGGPEYTSFKININPMGLYQQQQPFSPNNVNPGPHIQPYLVNATFKF